MQHCALDACIRPATVLGCPSWSPSPTLHAHIKVYTPKASCGAWLVLKWSYSLCSRDKAVLKPNNIYMAYVALGVVQNMTTPDMQMFPGMIQLSVAQLLLFDTFQHIFGLMNPSSMSSRSSSLKASRFLRSSRFFSCLSFSLISASCLSKSLQTLCCQHHATLVDHATPANSDVS